MNITHGNILAVFFSANESDILEGINWYPNAKFTSYKISQKYDLETYVVAGVIAALSPNNRWSRNISDAEALIKAFTLNDGNVEAVKVSTFGKNKEKATQILRGENPADVLGGLKVRAFYECIMGGESVCVDGHAYSIWLGQRVPTTKTPKISPKLYATIQADYLLAAEQISKITGKQYTGSDIQAITWLAWRNLYAGRGV
jgi:hypothetical protein